MFNIVRSEFEWCGKKIILETGKVGRQSDASIIVRCASTVLMVNVTVSFDIRDNVDFLPLTVNYLEKYYSVGRFPGGFVKRESRPSEREILLSRLIDRAIRPLFPKDFFHEVSVTCTLLSYDKSIYIDLLAFIAVSSSLKISSIPIQKTIALIRVGFDNNKFMLNVLPNNCKNCYLDLIIAGTKDFVLMIESSSNEMSDDLLIEAINLGQKAIVTLVEKIDYFVSLVKFNKMTYYSLDNSTILNQLIDKKVDDDIKKTLATKSNKERLCLLDKIYQNEFNNFSSDKNFKKNIFDMAFKKLKREVFRQVVLETNIRIDGRSFDQVREVFSEINFLPKAHGSSLFTRGETQAIAVVTLGGGQDMQMVDNILGVEYEKFMLHYNFPSYSVGECGQLRAPNRREIGHGKLAMKSLRAVMPSQENFPYTVRVVCEITESNGSSSMATVCASSMALMQAGVPISAAVSGIAMGLILNNKRCVILSDISGEEDFLGDMDFKVAATSNGITGLQLDVKVLGITVNILRKVLKQASYSNNYIRNMMGGVINKANNEMQKNAPRFYEMVINKNKIKNLIGAAGKVIKNISDKSRTKVDVNQDGKVSIFSLSEHSLKIAIEMINEIVTDPIVGKEYVGKIISIKKFGIFVKFFGSIEGLVHISQLPNKKIDNIVEKAFQNGNEIKVKLLSINRGRYSLSMIAIK